MGDTFTTLEEYYLLLWRIFCRETAGGKETMIITEVIPRVFVVFIHSTDAIPPITSSLVLDIVYSTEQTLSRVIGVW